MRCQTDPVRIEGRLNDNKYIDSLHKHLLPFVEDNHGGTSHFLLQEDNCRPHRAHTVGKYLALHGVRRLDWAAQSPDMNPIKLLGACWRPSCGSARSILRPWKASLLR